MYLQDHDRKKINQAVKSLLGKTRDDAFLYVNYPFCLNFCRFCVYKNYRFNRKSSADFLADYRQEISLRAKALDGFKFKNVHLGGGTPNLIPPQSLIGPLSKLVDFEKVERFVVEVYPKADFKKYLAQAEKYQVGKIQLGVQTLNERILKSEHRPTAQKIILNCLKTLSQSGLIWSVDLIYGFKNEKKFKRDYLTELKTILDYRPSGVHLYLIRSEKKNQYYKSRPGVSEVDFGADISPAEKLLSARGYEMINDEWAIGKNIAYAQKTICYDSRAEMVQPDIWGVGPGATSYHRLARLVNTRKLSEYKDLLKKNLLPIIDLNDFQKNNLYPVFCFYKRFRMTAGFDFKDFFSAVSLSKDEEKEARAFIGYLKENGLIRASDEQGFKITDQKEFARGIRLVEQYIQDKEKA